jgi:DNA-binding NarL/FixJ family response regulator
MKGGLHVGDKIGLAQLNEAQALIQPLETDAYHEKIDQRASVSAASTKTDGFIALIESRAFVRECVRRSMQSAFSLQIRPLSEAIELQQKCHTRPNLILLSALEENKEASADDFKILSQIAPGIPIIVLACNNDAQMAKAAIRHGAKGYIPVTLGFDIAIEAVRFVLAGGTYVPIDYLLTRTWLGNLPSGAAPASGAVTARELAVVRAIQQGKSNKVIAYELGMCESTVKVHVRHVMKKLNAKNRTDAAIKSQTVLSTFRTNNCLELSA